jgi:hypothetical protein
VKQGTLHSCSRSQRPLLCCYHQQVNTELKNAGPEPKKFGVADGYLGSVSGLRLVYTAAMRQCSLLDCMTLPGTYTVSRSHSCSCLINHADAVGQALCC